MSYPLIKHSYLLLIFSLLLQLGCAQPPSNRPHVSNEAFDDKVSSLLSFSVPAISVKQLKKVQQEVFLFDTRQQKEFDVSHIEGARYLGYKDFDPNRLGDLPKDAPIVLYCSIGYRSEKIGEKLQELGYTNVSNLYGSLFEWVNLGNEIVNKHGETTNEVHTYNRNWSKWIEDKGKVKKVY